MAKFTRTRGSSSVLVKLLLILGWSLALLGEGTLPVAIVSSAEGAQLLRQGSALPILARPGELLYPGDRLEGKAVVAVCRQSEQLVLSPDVTISKPATCVLPPLERDREAIGRGVARTRSVFLEEPSGESKNSPGRDAMPAQPFVSLVDRVTRAETLAQQGKPIEAADQYRALIADFPDAKALGTERLFVLEEEEIAKKEPAKSPQVVGKGKTYALLVGISDYENAQIRPLKYAHADALAAEQFLRSPRGGGLAPEDILLLTNEQATAGAIRNAFETLLMRTTPQDTVVILLAAHGAVVENPRSRSRGAFLVAYDSDPEDLNATGLSMSVVQKFIREDLAKTARVLAFIDACRSGTIGTIPDRSKLKINAALDSLAQTDSQLFLFTASRPGEISYEGRQYGGGHGAFSFFLLQGLNGAADFDANGRVNVNELVNYVQQKVAEATVDKQHPREAGTLDMNIGVSNLSKEGIDLGTFRPGDTQESSAARTITRTPSSQPVHTILFRQTVDLNEALSAGRILPDQPDNAFTALRQIKMERRLNRDQLLDVENRLKTALEDRNQKTILRYLRGDEMPMSKDDFAEAARTVNAAMQMNGETPALLSRLQFCEGRIAIFEKNYGEARKLLESALRLDPDAAYIYNALGTAYLEQADYGLAEKAFVEASHKAPYWAYPLHNLALTYSQRGEYEQALKAYDEAIRLSPQATYLVYNQGLIYLEINRQKEAEKQFRLAAEHWPERPEPLNALGVLRQRQGKLAEAEKLFRSSLERLRTYLAARQNLADLVAERGRTEEAFALWEENLKHDSSFVPSRLSVARHLASTGRQEESIAQYRVLVAQTPEFVSARLALAELLAASGQHEGAMDQLVECRRIQPGNALITLRQADLTSSSGNSAQAAEIYAAALREASDPGLRRKIRSKIEAIGAANR